MRATASHKLVAFVSAIPVSLRVRGATVRCSEINYLVVHKKLRGKRLAPVLIKEVTRVSHLNGIFQGLYSAGVIIPKPIATCRYFHRSLDWEKLYDVGFSPLPPDSTKARQIARFRLPEKTATHGLRELRRADCEKARALLTRYLGRFAMALEFTAEEFEHWFLHEESPPPGDGAGAEARKPERVVYTYVVEDAATGRLTDLVSYYALASSAIKSTKHDTVNAAYLFYYATERAWEGDDGAGAGGGVSRELKARLNALVHDALILAKNVSFPFPFPQSRSPPSYPGLATAPLTLDRTASTSSTRSRCSTTLSSSSSSASARATASCTSTSSTTAPRRCPAAWMSRTARASGRWAGSGSSCSDGGLGTRCREGKGEGQRKERERGSVVRCGVVGRNLAGLENERLRAVGKGVWSYAWRRGVLNPPLRGGSVAANAGAFLQNAQSECRETRRIAGGFFLPK